MNREKKLITERHQVSDNPKKQRRRRRTKAEMEADRMLKQAASGGVDLEPVLDTKPDDVSIVDTKKEEKEAQKALFDYLEIPVGALDAKKPGVFFKPGSADTLEKHFNDLIKAGYSVRPLGFNRDRLALWFYK